jgi:hypothetical protein
MHAPLHSVGSEGERGEREGVEGRGRGPHFRHRSIKLIVLNNP